MTNCALWIPNIEFQKVGTATEKTPVVAVLSLGIGNKWKPDEQALWFGVAENEVLWKQELDRQ